MKRNSTPNEFSRETSEALGRFATLLLRWNRTVNLIARNDEQRLWERHINDLLQLAALMQPAPERAIDLGAGAGFPGLVLAIVTGVHFDLIEADQRKAAFLAEAARITSAPVHVHATRIETAQIIPAPLITARALAPLPMLLDLAAPLLAARGICLFLKGANVQAELTDAASRWHMQVKILPSQTAREASILRISDLNRVAPPN